MAARVVFLYYIVLVLALCLLLKNHNYVVGDTTVSLVVNHHSRKLILHDSMEEVLASFQPLDHSISKKIQDVDSLRTVPSGPDPLHHHGSSPKKPQTP
ncbi:hypothetical protein MKW94_006814 [Papaver nudicaule]|uniref:Uncharacterized protein n=1 Tax=Papaver nudicaule TaxID=74823 RepID=A0AA41VHQ1_PAPNU|nr:hypothetical protein [Papaver nudicaule]